MAAGLRHNPRIPADQTVGRVGDRIVVVDSIVAFNPTENVVPVLHGLAARGRTHVGNNPPPRRIVGEDVAMVTTEHLVAQSASERAGVLRRWTGAARCLKLPRLRVYPESRFL